MIEQSAPPPIALDALSAEAHSREVLSAATLTAGEAGLTQRERTGYLAAKRALDVISSAAGLVALAPVLGALALAVRLDSRGPILFRQKRLGRHGREFSLLKFRSMYSGSAVVFGPDRFVANPKGDPRVTPVGRFLRRTSLDELPQLMNVLAGSMSLVGPRPDLPVALTMYTPIQARKLDVKPGITGLAQVSGRNLLSGSERWNLDAEYATTATLALDLKILAMTVLKVITQEGVYADGG